MIATILNNLEGQQDFSIHGMGDIKFLIMEVTLNHCGKIVLMTDGH